MTGRTRSHRTDPRPARWPRRAALLGLSFATLASGCGRDPLWDPAGPGAGSGGQGQAGSGGSGGSDGGAGVGGDGGGGGGSAGFDWPGARLGGCDKPTFEVRSTWEGIAVTDAVWSVDRFVVALGVPGTASRLEAADVKGKRFDGKFGLGTDNPPGLAVAGDRIAVSWVDRDSNGQGSRIKVQIVGRDLRPRDDAFDVTTALDPTRVALAANAAHFGMLPGRSASDLLILDHDGDLGALFPTGGGLGAILRGRPLVGADGAFAMAASAACDDGPCVEVRRFGDDGRLMSTLSTVRPNSAALAYDGARDVVVAATLGAEVALADPLRGRRAIDRYDNPDAEVDVAWAGRAGDFVLAWSGTLDRTARVALVGPDGPRGTWTIEGLGATDRRVRLVPAEDSVGVFVSESGPVATRTTYARLRCR